MPQSGREVNVFGALRVGLKYYAALYEERFTRRMPLSTKHAF